MKIFDIRYSIAGVDNSKVISFNVNHSVNSDCAATITLYKEILSENDIPSNVSITLQVKPSDAISYTSVALFEGEVTGYSIGGNQISISARSGLNKDIQKGTIKEILNVPENIRNFIFGIRPGDNIIYRKFHDQACQYTGANYYKSKDTVVRKVIKNKEDISDLPSIDAPTIEYLPFNNTLSVTKGNSDTLSKTSIPNVIDIVYTISWTRANFLVKQIRYHDFMGNAGETGISDVNATMTVEDKTIYKTRSLPAELNIILSAMSSAGWSVYPGNTLYDPVYSDITEYLKPDKVLYKVQPPNDIRTADILGKRIHKQQMSKSYIVRLINHDSIAKNGCVYKRIDKNKTYEYDQTVEVVNPNFSTYIDAVYIPGFTTVNTSPEASISIMLQEKEDAIDALVEQAKAEMYTYNTVNYSDSVTVNSILTKNTIGLLLPDLPAKLETVPIIDTPENPYVVKNRSVNFDVSSATATISFTGYALSENEEIDEIEKDPIPDIIDIDSNTPEGYTNIGVGTIGTVGDWNDPDDYAFENSVMLRNKYSNFIDPDSFIENSNPDLTLSNYYTHRMYISKKYTPPFVGASSSGCRIKADPVKPAYTKALILPPSYLDDIEV